MLVLSWLLRHFDLRQTHTTTRAKEDVGSELTTIRQRHVQLRLLKPTAKMPVSDSEPQRRRRRPAMSVPPWLPALALTITLKVLQAL